MRLPVALAILLVPSAAAASEVHVTYDGASYYVGFESEAAAPDVRVDGREVHVERANGTSWLARVAAADLTYVVEGRSFSLKRPPAPDESTRIVFVADIGTEDRSEEVVAAIVAAEPDLVLIGGDLAYAHANATVWSEWFTLMEPLAAHVPTMPAYGNHEDVCDRGNGTYAPCPPERNQWPYRFELPGDELFYAFDWGPVRVTVLDTEAWQKDEGEHASGRTEQVAFLEDSLETDERRWDLVMFHRPLRTTSTRDGMASEDAREDLDPLLRDGADVVLAGHLHAYERSRVVEGEPLTITSGGGGRTLYDQWGPEAPWLATRAVEHHFVLLDVTPTRIEGRALRIDGSTFDSFAIERPAPPTPPTPTNAPTVHGDDLPPPLTATTVPTPPMTTTPGTPTSTATPPASPQATPIPLASVLVAIGLAAVARFARKAK